MAASARRGSGDLPERAGQSSEDYAFYPDPGEVGPVTASSGGGADPFGLHLESPSDSHHGNALQRKDTAGAAPPPRVSSDEGGPLTEIGTSARSVLDAAEMAGLALATSKMPDADLVRLNDAVLALGDVLHEHAGDRIPVDERTMRSALRAASQIADALARRDGPRSERELALRQRIAMVERLAVAAEAPRGAADVSPAELLTQLDASLAQLMMASDLATAAGDRQAIDHAIEKTMTWQAALSTADASRSEARRLATAIHQQQALLFDASNELQEAISQGPAGSNGQVVSAYLQAMAKSTERKERAERALELARIERRRQPLANAEALLEADESTALKIGELDPAAGRKARKQRALTEDRQEALEARLVSGRRVSDYEIRDLEVQAREQAFMHRTQLMELQARQLAAALNASDDGFGGLPNKIDVDVGRLASDLLSLAEEFPIYRDAYKRRVAAAEDEHGATLEGRWTILAVRSAALDEAEARMRKWLASGDLQATLQAAMQKAEQAQARTFALQLIATVALTLAGNVAASAARGAAEGAWVARASRLGAGEVDMLAVGAEARSIAHGVGIATDLAVNAAGQKLQGDDASILTLLTVNAVNALVIGKLNQRFDQIESIHVTLSGWSRVALREALSLPIEMIAGGALDYGTRMLVQGQANHNVTEQEAAAWFWQGASMALGRHINTRVKVLRKRLEVIENASRDLTANLLQRSDAITTDSSGILASGDVDAARTLVSDYQRLLADAGSVVEPGSPASVTRDGGSGKRPWAPDNDDAVPVPVHDQPTARVSADSDGVPTALPDEPTVKVAHAEPAGSVTSSSRFAEPERPKSPYERAIPHEHPQVPVEVEAALRSPDGLAAAINRSTGVEKGEFYDRVDNVSKGPQYDEAMQQLRDFYGNMEVEAQSIRKNAGRVADGPFRWAYANDAQSFSHGLSNIVVRIAMKPLPGVDGAALAAVKQRVTKAIDEYYNFGKSVRGADGVERRLHLEIVFVDDPAQAHLQVRLFPGNGVARATAWFVGGHPTTDAHEVGHSAFGLKDEYADGINKPPGRETPNSPGVAHDDSLMGFFWADRSARRVKPGTSLKDRHLEAIGRMTPGVSAPKSTDAPHVPATHAEPTGKEPTAPDPGGARRIQAARDLRDIPIATERQMVAGEPRTIYRVSDEDSARMIALLPLLGDEVRLTMTARGFIVLTEDGAIAFERHSVRANATDADDESRRAVLRDGERSPLGLPSPNVAVIQYKGFRGVRTVRGVRIEDIDPVARARVERMCAQFPLLRFGHVGLSLDGGATVLGFAPDRGSRPNLTDAEFVELIKSNEPVPGLAGDDTEIFRLAAKLAADEGWSTEVETSTQVVDVEKKTSVAMQLDNLMANDGRGAGEGHGKSYQFPYAKPGADGSHYRDSCTRNCATFMDFFGLPVPEPSGLLAHFIPALRRWAEISPIDHRSPDGAE